MDTYIPELSVVLARKYNSHLTPVKLKINTSFLNRSILNGSLKMATMQKFNIFSDLGTSRHIANSAHDKLGP